MILIIDKRYINMYYLSVFLARAGVCARRKAVVLIKNGQVTVNGKKIIDPTVKVSEKDTILLDGKAITIQKFLYILFNKPRGCLTAVSDNRGRKTVLDYISVPESVFPVGRLDRETTGLLLLTNDGILAQELMHPKFGIEKEYHVTLDKLLQDEDFKKIKAGITLHDGFIKVDSIFYLEKNNNKNIGIIIHSGKKRIIRRIFSFCGYNVTDLDRVRYAHLKKQALKQGTYRILSEKELKSLKQYMQEKRVKN